MFEQYIFFCIWINFVDHFASGWISKLIHMTQNEWGFGKLDQYCLSMNSGFNMSSHCLHTYCTSLANLSNDCEHEVWSQQVPIQKATSIPGTQ